MAGLATSWAAAWTAGLLALAPAMAQTGTPWIDPPAAIEPPAPSASSPADKAPSAAGESQPPASRSPDRSAVPRQARPAHVDPPPRPAEAAPPREAAPSIRSARPRRNVAPNEERKAARSSDPHEGALAALEGTARQVALDYLDFWSAPNAVTVETTPGFYAPRVEFHGREMSARALVELKRRFVRRWPVRAYTPQLDTMRVDCREDEVCRVRTAFTFMAISPDRGRRSQGMGNLELEISFARGRPVIVAETSRVVQRGRIAGRQVTWEEAEDD